MFKTKKSEGIFVALFKSEAIFGKSGSNLNVQIFKKGSRSSFSLQGSFGGLSSFLKQCTMLEYADLYLGE